MPRKAINAKPTPNQEVRTKTGQVNKAAVAVDGPKFGVFDERKIYNQHAIARILGSYDYRWVIRNLFAAGLPHARFGNVYLVSGRQLNLWVEALSRPWEPLVAQVKHEQEAVSRAPAIDPSKVATRSGRGRRKRSDPPGHEIESTA